MKNVVGAGAKLGNQMVKEDVPFDAGKATKAMNDINGVPDKYVTLFPKGTEHGAIADSQAKPEIWEDFDKFKATAAKLKDASAKAAGAAAQGKDAFTAAFRRFPRTHPTSPMARTCSPPAAAPNAMRRRLGSAMTRRRGTRPCWRAGAA